MGLPVLIGHAFILTKHLDFMGRTGVKYKACCIPLSPEMKPVISQASITMMKTITASACYCFRAPRWPSLRELDLSLIRTRELRQGSDRQRIKNDLLQQAYQGGSTMHTKSPGTSSPSGKQEHISACESPKLSPSDGRLEAPCPQKYNHTSKDQAKGGKGLEPCQSRVCAWA